MAAAFSVSEETWQTEIAHRYVLGVYELQAKLTTNFPHLLLENCAAGGKKMTCLSFPQADSDFLS